MFAHSGVPAELHNDQGQNFEAKILAAICKRLGVGHSDRLVEQFNHTLTTQQAILTSQHQCNWDRHRSAVQESSLCSPVALMFGRGLRTPVDLMFEAEALAPGLLTQVKGVQTYVHTTVCVIMLCKHYSCTH